MGRAADAIGQFIAYWGFKSIHGRLWTLLAVSRRPQSQAVLARELGVSRALISLSVDELENFGLVRRVGPGRNAPYEAVFDIWPTIADVLRSREWLLIETARSALEAALEEVRAADGANQASRYDPDRLAGLLAMTEVAQGFVKLLLRMRSAPGVEAFSGWVGKASGLLANVRAAWAGRSSEPR